MRELRERAGGLEFGHEHLLVFVCMLWSLLRIP